MGFVMLTDKLSGRKIAVRVKSARYFCEGEVGVAGPLTEIWFDRSGEGMGLIEVCEDFHTVLSRLNVIEG